MSGFINLEKLPYPVKKRFIPFLEELLSVHGDQVVSVFIYGSATGQNYIHEISDINSVVVFSDLNFSVLKKSLKTISKGKSQKITAPLFLTKAHIESSLDVFPLEFLDMKENYVVIYGEDILSKFQVNSQHVRLLCEHELKGKLIRIRQAYLEGGLDKKHIKMILQESLNSLIPIFKNLIRLKNKQPLADKEKVLLTLCQEFGLNQDVFLLIYKDRTKEAEIAHADAEIFIERYLAELQKLVSRVDEL